MSCTNWLLGCICIIEFLNLCVRLIKLAPPKDPPIDEEMRKKLYS